MCATIILCSANVLAAANDPQSDHAFHPSRDVASTTEKHGPIGGFCVSGGRTPSVSKGHCRAAWNKRADSTNPSSDPPAINLVLNEGYRVPALPDPLGYQKRERAGAVSKIQSLAVNTNQSTGEQT